ncbi:hypothetical protein GCM10020367_58760 [Streptomyces sannanensis]|uniref:Uncharacterized protein n=1 Tax=Streptomyces sannanensis TaxID=285536 RepID=A0ABP6SK57_9ACTN
MEVAHRRSADERHFGPITLVRSAGATNGAPVGRAAALVGGAGRVAAGVAGPGCAATAGTSGASTAPAVTAISAIRKGMRLDFTYGVLSSGGSAKAKGAFAGAVVRMTA